MRPRDRPAVLVARMAFAQALSARARGDARAGRGPPATRPRGHWRRLATPSGWAREHLASLVDLGRPPMAGVVDPDRELDRIDAELESDPSIAEEPHAHFDDTAQRPVEEVWKLLYDPSRFPGWWDGRGDGRARGRDGGRLHAVPRGLSRLPDAAGRAHGGDGRTVTISCLVSDLEFAWRSSP